MQCRQKAKQNGIFLAHRCSCERPMTKKTYQYADCQQRTALHFRFGQKIATTKHGLNFLIKINNAIFAIGFENETNTNSFIIKANAAEEPH